IEKGHDPRDFAYVAFGGGGSLVASALASRLRIPTVVVPTSPGTFSAWGMLTLDVVHDFAQTSLSALDQLAPEDILQRFRELEERAQAALEREGIPSERRLVMRSIDMRYEGQEHVLTVPVDSAMLGSLSQDGLRGMFDE